PIRRTVKRHREPALPSRSALPSSYEDGSRPFCGFTACGVDWSVGVRPLASARRGSIPASARAVCPLSPFDVPARAAYASGPPRYQEGAPPMRRQSLIEYGKPLQTTEADTPKPQGTEVLLRVSHCGVCHSDIHLQDGYFDLGGGQKLDVRGN